MKRIVLALLFVGAAGAAVLAAGQTDKTQTLDPSSVEIAPKKVASATKTTTIDESTLNIEVWIDGLDALWALEFTGDGDALITEQGGQLRRVIGGKLQEAPIAGMPAVWARGQGGLLDVAIDPDYADNGWVYLSYSHALSSDPKKAMTKLVRGKIKNNTWSEQQVLFEAKPEHYIRASQHFGSRITFDGDGHVFFSIGERGQKDMAQDITLPNGKVHRLMRDGSTPQDNPFIGNTKAYPSIFSYGNRNPQGLIYVDGTLWETEHGPRGGDELNIIKPGKNYGWPEISYGRNYSGTELTPYTHLPDMEQPESQWTPSIAACGLDVYDGNLFKDWNGYLLAGALKYQELRLIEVKDGAYVSEQILLKGHGRVRDVTTGPDGAIYVVLNGPDQILRLTPQEK